MDKNRPHSERTPPQIRASTESKKASAQLRNDKTKIKSLWEQRIRAKVQDAERQTSLALQNSLNAFLDELILALEQSTMTESYDPSKQGMSKMHGEQRASFRGYFLPQLLQEFSLLREIILEDLFDAQALTFEAGLIINSSIDSAISVAATEFAAIQQASIKAALEKAETSNRDLEQFAAVAAHDLKSPLATISGYLELLEDEAKGQLAKSSFEYITVMQKASQRMRNLVDRLLDYARLSKSDRPFQVLDTNEVVKSALLNLHDSVRKTGANVTFDNLPIVKGDPDLLMQLFQNLIANSIKFHGSEAPQIHIDCVAQDDTVLFSLRDNGIGFDPKDKENIFTLYKKLPGEESHQGIGIGLATCRKVVELHGGQIWAESKPNVGSTFYFTLPNPTHDSPDLYH